MVDYLPVRSLPAGVAAIACSLAFTGSAAASYPDTLGPVKGNPVDASISCPSTTTATTTRATAPEADPDR
jgi:hypothetical protein